MPMLTQTSPNSFEASARVEIKEFEKLSKINFFKENNSEDVETLGGLVVAMAGRVPQRGEILKHESGLTFEINDADPKRIKSIKITYKKP
jgi:magnesium and cobalt transporter